MQVDVLLRPDSVHSANKYGASKTLGNCSPTFAAIPHFLGFVPSVELCNISISQSLGKVIPLTQCEEFCEGGRRWLAVHLLDAKQIVR